MKSSNQKIIFTIPGVVILLIIVIWIYFCWRRGTCCFRRFPPQAVALHPGSMSSSVIQHAPAPQPSPSMTNNYFTMSGQPNQMQGQPTHMEKPPPYMPHQLPYPSNHPPYNAGHSTYSSPPPGYNSSMEQYSPHANYSPHQGASVPPHMVKNSHAPPEQPMFNPMYHASAPKS